MKIISSTPNNTIIQINQFEIEKSFDQVWDEIRLQYPSDQFKMSQLDSTGVNGIIFFELKRIDSQKKLSQKKRII
jgi:hypothetical protein